MASEDSKLISLVEKASEGDRRSVGRLLTLVERGGDSAEQVAEATHTLSGKSHIIVPDGEENGREMLLRLDIITALFPAVNVDIGDSTIKITEVFKKI